jgi:hypothetical protein
LNLAESLGAAKKRNDSNNAHDRERLEQVPSAIVKEKHALHGNNGSEKQGMR